MAGLLRRKVDENLINLLQVFAEASHFSFIQQNILNLISTLLAEQLSGKTVLIDLKLVEILKSGAEIKYFLMHF